MANRHWTDNSQRKVSPANGYPAYRADGGKKLNDTPTPPPYPANIGPAGPDLNAVGFKKVQIATEARYMELGTIGAGQAFGGALKSIGPMGQGTSGVDWKTIGQMGEALSKTGQSMDQGKQDQGFKILASDSQGSVQRPESVRLPNRVLRREER